MQKKILEKVKNFTNDIDNWFAKANNYMYNFKDGHFQFPYVSNDPESMIEGLKKTPFVTHNESLQCLETNSAFMKIKLKYLKLNDGLWLTSTQSSWKVNVVAIALPLDNPSDYYFLTYSRLTDNVQIVMKESEHLFENNSHAWTFYKSNTALNAYFQKKCKSFAIVFMFDKNWLDAYILNRTHLNIDIINQLLEAENAYKNYIYNDDLIDTKFNNLYLDVNDIAINDIDIEQIQSKVLTLILGFFENIASIKLPQTYLENIKLKDRTKIERVEKLLCQTLTTGFLGINKLANEFEISPTKLKNDFKSVFGVGIFNYYQKKQMELSIELLKNRTPIKKIAETLSYESISKFSTRFKDFYGVLPSKYH